MLWYAGDRESHAVVDTDFVASAYKGEPWPDNWYVWIGCGAASGAFAGPLNERISQSSENDGNRSRLRVLKFVDAPNNRGHMAAIVAADVRGLDWSTASIRWISLPMRRSA